MVPTTPPISGAAAVVPRTVTGLRKTDEWARLAVPVAFAADGEHWSGADEHDLVVYDGDREVERFPQLSYGTDIQLAPLPGGGWIAGGKILGADGTVRVEVGSFAQRYGRFGSVKAGSISADGRIAIMHGADSPSTCLCDRDRGTGGGWDGGLVRFRLDREQVEDRILVEHAARVDYVVAASPTAVAAWSWGELSVWPATGDDAPVTAKIEGPELRALTWATDRYLVAVRYVDADREDIVVLDRDAGWQPAWVWPVPGYVRALQVRPGGEAVAIAWTNYRATDRVLRDDRKLGVFALDGTRRAEVDTTGYPAAVAWSPRGDALLLSTTGTSIEAARVTRFAVE